LIDHPTWIEIDLAQFRNNLMALRKQVGRARLCLPVKANAYGHGLVAIGKAAEAFGVDYLGVSCLQEGVALRKAGVTIPILVFGAIHESQIEGLICFQLEFSISSTFKADLVRRYLMTREGGVKCRVHLEIDTGMQRTGVRGETAISLVEYVRAMPCFEIVGVYSHFATADRPGDRFANEQIARFKELICLPQFQGLCAHLANSGGVAHYPESYLDMVRPGLLAYGYSSSGAVEGIAPCFSLKSRVSYFKVVEAGTGIGYGHTHVTKKRTRIVTVPIGYGDGYRRALSNRGSVLIGGKRFPIVGLICMDQFMVDVGESEVHVGDEVVLIGKQGGEEISVLEIASLCDTIVYELLCLFNERIPRVSSRGYCRSRKRLSHLDLRS
jgi:alanine racemase